MIHYDPSRLTSAVAAICPEIQQRLADLVEEPNERALWWELSACLLSSQVPFALAVSAADAIDRAGLLIDDLSQPALEARLASVLCAPLIVDGRCRSYRFPVARAAQLAATRCRVREEAGSLRTLIDRFEDAGSARDWFVAHAPGLGGKQASMFLRNAGKSYDLAVLDRHVLAYMNIVGLCQSSSTAPAGIKQYRRAEAVLRRHAHQMACPVGVMDWAIWIVMRVARCQKVLAG